MNINRVKNWTIFIGNLLIKLLILIKIIIYFYNSSERSIKIIKYIQISSFCHDGKWNCSWIHFALFIIFTFGRFGPLKKGITTILFQERNAFFIMIYTHLWPKFNQWYLCNLNTFWTFFFFLTNFTLHRSLICMKKVIETIGSKKFLSMKFGLKSCHETCCAETTFQRYLIIFTHLKIAWYLRIMTKQKNHLYL